MKRFVFLTILLPCLAQQPQPVPLQSPGTVAGTLTGDDGTLIGGALVALALLPPFPAGRLRQPDPAVISAADGSFQFSQLANGSYRICIQAPGSPSLNPCEWGLQPPLVLLGRGQPTTAVTVVVKKGALVPIRLSDPSGLLAQYEGTVPGAQVLIGVSNDALFFRRAPVVSADAGGRSCQVLMPFGVAVNLIVCSSFFQLSNAGVALRATSASVPITVQAGAQPTVVSLVVTGGGQP